MRPVGWKVSGPPDAYCILLLPVAKLRLRKLQGVTAAALPIERDATQMGDILRRILDAARNPDAEE